MAWHGMAVGGSIKKESLINFFVFLRFYINIWEVSENLGSKVDVLIQWTPHNTAPINAVILLKEPL